MAHWVYSHELKEASRKARRLDAKAGTVYWSDQLARLHGAPEGYTPSYDNALAHFAEEHRPELRMGIGDVQDACIAEALQVIHAGIHGELAIELGQQPPIESRPQRQVLRPAPRH